MTDYGEPWKVESLGPMCEILSTDDHLRVPSNNAFDPNIARRIVACVNACAGLATEMIERRGLCLTPRK
jgi:hypothetical protein